MTDFTPEQEADIKKMLERENYRISVLQGFKYVLPLLAQACDQFDPKTGAQTNSGMFDQAVFINFYAEYQGFLKEYFPQPQKATEPVKDDSEKQ